MNFIFTFMIFFYFLCFYFTALFSFSLYLTLSFHKSNNYIIAKLNPERRIERNRKDEKTYDLKWKSCLKLYYFYLFCSGLAVVLQLKTQSFFSSGKFSVILPLNITSLSFFLVSLLECLVEVCLTCHSILSPA